MKLNAATDCRYTAIKLESGELQELADDTVVLPIKYAELVIEKF